MGEHTASGHRLLKWSLGILVILLLGGAVLLLWPKSPRHTHADDIREAKAAGFEWYEREDPFEVVRRDWHNAFRKETWESYRQLELGKVPDLTPYRSLIHRLNPTQLYVGGCKNVDALEGLTELQKLDLWDCPALQNVDGLKGLTALQVLQLFDCPALQNVDVLKGLTALQQLYLRDCPALQNVDGLKGLTALQQLYLRDCPALQNVDVLKGLTALQSLNLEGSTGIPATALRALCAALPNTTIIFPDGTAVPPP